jgi:hypothetical protein
LLVVRLERHCFARCLGVEPPFWSRGAEIPFPAFYGHISQERFDSLAGASLHSIYSGRYFQFVLDHLNSQIYRTFHFCGENLW